METPTAFFISTEKLLKPQNFFTPKTPDISRKTAYLQLFCIIPEKSSEKLLDSHRIADYTLGRNKGDFQMAKVISIQFTEEYYPEVLRLANELGELTDRKPSDALRKLITDEGQKEIDRLQES